MKALMISKDGLLHAEIAAQGSARMPAVQLVASRKGLRDAVERLLPEAPELVVLDASDIADDEGELVDRLGKQYPGASFMLLTRDPQQDLLIRAMRAGMRECCRCRWCTAPSTKRWTASKWRRD
jgi:pilus assembly protein CpaE